MCELCHNFLNPEGTTSNIMTPFGHIKLCRACELVHKAEIAEHFHKNRDDSFDEYIMACVEACVPAKEA